jgi:hypothetical protein
VPVSYAFRFSGPVIALRTGKVKDRLSSGAAQLPSPVTDQSLLLLTNLFRQLHKLLICTLVNKLLTITRRKFSKQG